MNHLFDVKSFGMKRDLHVLSRKLPGPGQQPLIAFPVQRKVVEEVFRNLQACHISRVVSFQPFIFKKGAALLILTPNAASSDLAAIGCLLRKATILCALRGPMPGTLNSS